MATRKGRSRTPKSPARVPDGAGALVIVGGGEDRSPDGEIMRRFVEMSGGDKARIVVLCSATSQPDDVGPQYVDTFRKIGVAECCYYPVASRAEANDDDLVEVIAQSSGVYFTGGDQLRLGLIVGGSHLDTALQAGFKRGLIIGGTSAGAAIMSSTMIVGGADHPPAPDNVRIGAGLGFVAGLVVDMHFGQRGRLSRLLTVIAMFPHELGLGIDEDTAAVVVGNQFEVIGRGSVTVVDAGEVTSLRVPDERDGGTPIAMTGVQLHLLPTGYSFDLSTRRPLVNETPADADPDRTR